VSTRRPDRLYARPRGHLRLGDAGQLGARTLDCLVVAAGGRGAAILSWRGRRFVVSARGELATRIAPGAIVEVACAGFHDDLRTPKHARIARVRDDLAARGRGRAEEEDHRG
jgi:hypothetical protein